MKQLVPKSRSRKVNAYVTAVLALEAVQTKRDERYDRFVRALDDKRNRLVAEVGTRRRALTGGQHVRDSLDYRRDPDRQCVQATAG